MNWDFELASPNGLMRRGWNRNSMKIGDIVTVTGHRAKNNPLVGNASTVTLADGKKLFAGSSIENEAGAEAVRRATQQHARLRRCEPHGARSRPRCARVSLPAAAQWPTLRGEARAAQRRRQPSTSKRRRRARADGHPDLSGLWERVGPGGTNPNFDALQSPDGGPPAATFWNFGAGFAAACPTRPLAAMLRDERMADNQKNNPDALCLPMGLMQLHLHPQPRKIVQTPGLILIMYEGNEGLRQIFTDGRPLPDAGRRPAAVVVRLFGRAAGKATSSSSRPSASATTFGSTCRAAR